MNICFQTGLAPAAWGMTQSSLSRRYTEFTRDCGRSCGQLKIDVSPLLHPQPLLESPQQSWCKPGLRAEPRGDCRFTHHNSDNRGVRHWKWLQQTQPCIKHRPVYCGSHLYACFIIALLLSGKTLQPWGEWLAELSGGGLWKMGFLWLGIRGLSLLHHHLMLFLFLFWSRVSLYGYSETQIDPTALKFTKIPCWC